MLSRSQNAMLFHVTSKYIVEYTHTATTGALLRGGRWGFPLFTQDMFPQLFLISFYRV